MQLKICYVASDVAIPYFRGASTHVYEVAKNLAHLGHEVHVVSRRINRVWKETEKIDEFYVHRIYRGIITPLPFSGYQRLESEPKAGIKILERPYVWYLFNVYSFYAGIAASRIIKKFELNVILERETSFGAGAIASVLTKKPMALEVIGPRYSTFSLRRAKKIITYTKSLLRDSVSSERLELVTAAADIKAFRQQRDESKLIRRRYGLEGSPVVCYVGTFLEWHGIEDLIRASERILKKIPSTRFLMVGPYFKPTKDLTVQKGISDAYIFTGPVPYKNVSKFINAADVLVAPYNPAKSGSRKKYGIGSPLKVFEYMACGKPVVTTSIEPITQTIRNVKTGILVPPGDSKALSEAIIQLIENPKLAKKIGKAARKDVENHYSWEAFAKRLERILEETVKMPK